MAIQQPVMTKAIIRCIRRDNTAQPLFDEQSEVELGSNLRLWVWDIFCPFDNLWDDDLEVLCKQIEEKQEELILLKYDSDDFVLHIAVSIGSFSYPISIPNKLSCLSSWCGFGIEIYIDT